MGTCKAWRILVIPTWVHGIRDKLDTYKGERGRGEGGRKVLYGDVIKFTMAFMTVITIKVVVK